MRWQDIPASVASRNIQDRTMGPPMPPQQPGGMSLTPEQLMRFMSGQSLDYVSPQGKAWATAHMPQNLPLSPLPDPTTPGFVHPGQGFWQPNPGATNPLQRHWVSQGPRWQENANGTWTFGPDPNQPPNVVMNLPTHMQPLPPGQDPGGPSLPPRMPEPMPPSAPQTPPGRPGPQMYPGPLTMFGDQNATYP